MSRKETKKAPTLRESISKRIFTVGDAPYIVYVSVLLAMILLWRYRDAFDGLAGEFFIELFGVAFTIFIIDVLLVRSKVKRWKIVREDIDYLISRGINRLRDGVTYRAFNFNSSNENLKELRKERADFLNDLSTLSSEELKTKLNETTLFTPESYDFFNERAADIWDIINMKYSEYLSPVLVSQLINLHASLKDICAQINQYRKSEKIKSKQNFYRTHAINGISFHLDEVLMLVNKLKEEGYSEPARVSYDEVK